MEEQLISFEVAKLAKEKGFPQLNYPCYYDEKIYTSLISHSDFNKYYQSTQSLLQKWLREKYNIHILIYVLEDSNGNIYFDFGLKQIINYLVDKSCKPKEFTSYEDALEEGLLEALKLI